MMTKKWRYEDALINTDVEETIDLMVHRKLAFMIVRPMQYHLLFISPAHVTSASMGMGIIAGISAFLAAENGAYWFAIGGLCMLVSVLLDCADGMLARLRGGGTWFGYMLDGFADHVSGLAFWFGMSYSLTYDWQGWWVWPLNFAILCSIMVNVTLYDQFRNFYLAHAIRSPVRNKQNRKSEQGRLELILTVYYKKMYPTLFNALGHGGKAAVEMRPDDFRKVFKNPMRVMSFLGLGTHLFFFYVMAFIFSWNSHLASPMVLVFLVAAMSTLTLSAVSYWYITDKKYRCGADKTQI